MVFAGPTDAQRRGVERAALGAQAAEFAARGTLQSRRLKPVLPQLSVYTAACVERIGGTSDARYLEEDSEYSTWGLRLMGRVSNAVNVAPEVCGLGALSMARVYRGVVLPIQTARCGLEDAAGFAELRADYEDEEDDASQADDASQGSSRA